MRPIKLVSILVVILLVLLVVLDRVGIFDTDGPLGSLGLVDDDGLLVKAKIAGDDRLIWKIGFLDRSDDALSAPERLIGEDPPPVLGDVQGKLHEVDVGAEGGTVTVPANERQPTHFQI